MKDKEKNERLDGYLKTLGHILVKSNQLSVKIQRGQIDSQAMALAETIPMLIEEAKKFYDEWNQLVNKENALA